MEALFRQQLADGDAQSLYSVTLIDIEEDAYENIRLNEESSNTVFDYMVSQATYEAMVISETWPVYNSQSLSRSNFDWALLTQYPSPLFLSLG